MQDVTMSDGFVFNLPVWVIVNEPVWRRDGLGAGICVMTHPQFGPLLALFTDRHLAERYIEDRGTPDRAPLEAPRATLRLLLKHFDDLGAENVAFDCPTETNPRIESGRFYRIQQVLDALGR